MIDFFCSLSGKNKDLDVFFEEHLPNSFKDTIKLTIMNPKAQAIFAHILVDAIFIYLLCVNKKPNEINFKNNCEILENIVQTYYGCHEKTLNGSLCMHILLWNANAPNPNELVKKLRDNEQFQNGLLKYLDNIISQNILNCDPNE